MESGSLRHVITIQERVETSDGMGAAGSVLWRDWTNHDDWAGTTAYILGDLIGPTTANGHYYLCSRVGTSGGTEPTFPTTDDQTVNDPDGSGAQWTCKTPKVRASIWPIKATEQLDNMKAELSVTHRIRIRYLSGITADMRIEHGSRHFDIRSLINPEERNRMIEILAEEVI